MHLSNLSALTQEELDDIDYAIEQYAIEESLASSPDYDFYPLEEELVGDWEDWQELNIVDEADLPHYQGEI